MSEHALDSARQALVAPAARRVLDRLRAAGHECYLVGGCVRDLLRGEPPADFDLATAARPEEVTAVYPKARGVGAHFGVMLVREGGRMFEVATFRADGPPADGRRPQSVRFTDAAEDARRRDFTINGLFYDPAAGRVIDHVGGVADLQAGLVRAIGDPAQRFVEDRLRMLRAARFAARLDYEIEDATAAAVRAQAPAIHEIAAERIGMELAALLVLPARRRGVALLDALGLLAEVLPEVKAMQGVAQPPDFHPEGDVWVHTLGVLDHLPPEASLELACGALLHDVGKPPTFRQAEDRIRFDGHVELGRDMARAIGRRLRFSNERIDRIADLVAQHLRFAHLDEMREAKRRRFVLQPHFDEHLALHRADCLASHRRLDHYEACRRLLDTIAAEAPCAPPLAQRLLTGDHLVAAGYRPGPCFREMMEHAYDAQLERRIADTAAALALIRDRFGPPPGAAPA